MTMAMALLVVVTLAGVAAVAEKPPIPDDIPPGRTWVTDDAVVVEAAVVRGGRQSWPGAVLPAGPCFSTQGKLGKCTSFRACYPYFKLPDFSTWETWVLGVFDTCSYFSESGRQMFGVCCTDPQGRPPASTPGAAPAPLPVPVAPAEPQPQPDVPSPAPVPVPVPVNPVSVGNPVPDQWPPPIPTHSPDQLTHPPLPTHATAMPPTATTEQSSKKPPAVVVPQPPRPAVPPSNWPPPLPTHPPASRPPTPVTQRPQWPPTLATKPPTAKPPTVKPPTAKPPVPVPVPTPAPAPVPAPAPTPAPESGDGRCGAKNGYQDQERIVGGQNADVGEWPWIAALFNGGRQFCGGSLIDSSHILTAAHCVAHMSSWDVARLSVRLGDHNIKTNSETLHVEKKVRRVVRHRGFDSRTLYNDIAIITLDSPVTFTKDIRPICMPSGSTAYSGKTATVIGWGSLRESGPQPAVLQEVSIPVWTNTECRAKYGNAAPGGIVDTFLCAGQASRDSCSGDSGGPLMVNDGRWTQVGIVSWGIGCGKGQYPGVYTRVTSFMSWINKNLK